LRGAGVALLLAIVFIATARPALADRQLQDSGDIVVVVQDELGNSISGATVTLQLPGTDGVLNDGNDEYITLTDGMDDDDGTAADGDVEFDSGVSENDEAFNNWIFEAESFSVKVFAAGFVDQEILNAYYYFFYPQPEIYSSNEFTVQVSGVMHHEIDTPVVQSASDEVDFWDTAGCTGGQASPLSGPVFDSDTGAFYVGLPDGNYYTRYRRPGFVDACDTTQISVSTGSQAITPFTGTSLDYGLKLEIYDQYGEPVTNAAVTHGGTAPGVSSAGALNNEYYFSTTATGGVEIVKDGYQTINAGDNTVGPGGYTYSTDQTYLTLTGAANGAIGTVSRGQTVTRNGLVHDFNVQVTVLLGSEDPPTGITGLKGNADFQFLDGSAGSIFPEAFSEVDSELQPGVYNFKVATSAVTVQTLNVDMDSDPYVDLIDSDPLPLTGISAAFQSFGSIVAYKSADHILLTASDFAAGSTQPVTISVLDNDGMAVSTGPHSALGVSFSMSGGSTDPMSQKDIVSTTLSSATPSSVVLSAGASDTQVTGYVDPTSGNAIVAITDRIATEGSPLLLTVSPASASVTLPQYTASNTTNLPVTVTHASLSGGRIVIFDPADTTTDATTTVRIEVQDMYGNRMTSQYYSFRIMLSGNAVVSDVTDGRITSGKGSGTATVESDDGLVTAVISDNTIETVTISVYDPSPVDPLDYSSTQDVVFSIGDPAKVVFDSATPSVQLVNEYVTVKCLVTDSVGNTITDSNEMIQVLATGASTADSPVFATPPVVYSNYYPTTDKNKIKLRIENGEGIVRLTDSVEQIVSLSVTAPLNSGLDVSSTMDVTFATTLQDRLEISAPSTTLPAGDMSGAFTVYYRDPAGNATTTASILTVSLSSSNAGTGVFYNSSQEAITSVTIGAGQGSASFYYSDITAGLATLTASAADTNPGTVSITVTPGPPADPALVSIRTSTPETDPAQGTGKKYRQYFTTTATQPTIIEYPYTSSSSAEDKILAGTEQGVIRIYIRDIYGNPLSGEPFTLKTTLDSELDDSSDIQFNPASTTTDENGFSLSVLTGSTAGTATIRVDLTAYTAYDYGETFYVRFRTEDMTPPAIDRSGSATLVNGDLVDSRGPIRIKVTLSDPGEGASGVDVDSISVTVQDSSLQVASGTTIVYEYTAAARMTGDFRRSAAQSASGTTYMIEWTPASVLQEGNYTVTLTVGDKMGNTQSETWMVEVTSSMGLRKILSGPGIFDPRTGEPVKIVFQVPEDGTTVTIEIYNRAGRLVHMETNVFNAGYNEFEWYGRVMGGDFAGNGIYVFRLSAMYPSGATSRHTGKLAVFKN